MTTVTGNNRRRVHAGRIVIGDHDTPVCDIHGDTAHTTGMTVETGASMYRCNVCGASGWVGV